MPANKTALLPALVLLSTSCKTPSPGVERAARADAAPVSPPHASATPDASQATVGDGAHDFNGSIGKRAVSVHLVRAASSVTGAYLYASIGRPIALTGTVDDAGAIELTETVDGATTGRLHLRGAAGGLAGEWVDPRGASVAEVSLSPAPPNESLLHPVDASKPDSVDGTYRDAATGSEISVTGVDEKTLKVKFDLLYPYRSPMGPTANLGSASGTAKLEGNVATYTDNEFGPCTIHMTFAPRRMLKVTQDGTDFDCGFGHNVIATGTYVRVSGAKPRLASPDGE